MNEPQRRRNGPPRRRSTRSAVSANLWRRPDPLGGVEPIEEPHDVSALLRSLGDPPIAGGAIAAGYFQAVAERSAAIARALAFSVDLLAESQTD